MDTNNFQRVGSVSNTQAGNDFEAIARAFFSQQGISLVKNFSVPVGVGEAKKLHRFDLGSENPPVLVECKSHTWTSGGNMPSAKMTVWNEAMYFRHPSGAAAGAVVGNADFRGMLDDSPAVVCSKFGRHSPNEVPCAVTACEEIRHGRSALLDVLLDGAERANALALGR